MFKSKWIVAIHLVAFALAVEVVYLVIQNRQLSQSLDTITQMRSSSAAQSMPETLEVGDQLPNLRLVDLEGNVRSLERNGKRKLLFAFSSQCPACQDSVEVWQALKSVLEDAVEVMGISTDDARDLLAYRDQQQLTYPILTGDPGTLREALELTLVPLTILLDPDSRVLGIWKGAVDMSHLDPITQTAMR